MIHTYDRLAELAVEGGDVQELERILVSAHARLPHEPRILEMGAVWVEQVAMGMADDGEVAAAIALLLRHVDGSPARDTFLHNCAALAVREASRLSNEGAHEPGEALLAQTLQRLRGARAAPEVIAMVESGLGAMYFAMERYSEAARSWRAVLQGGWDPNGAIRTNLFAALMNQAVRAYNAGDCRAAAGFAQEALGVNPSDAQAHRIVARCGR